METIKIKSKDAKKEKFVKKLIEILISALNNMVSAVQDWSPESEIDKLYKSVEKFIEEHDEETESPDFLDMMEKLSKKIESYAELQGPHHIDILAKFMDFISKLEKNYGSSIEFSESSILLHLTFSSRRGYERYQRDLQNGRIGKLIIDLILYPPVLESFSLKADDIEISLNGRELTQQTGTVLM